MKHLIIIGVGGFAREIYWVAQHSRGYGVDWDIKGFIDGDVKLSTTEYNKLLLPVLGDINNYNIDEMDIFICAIGTPAIRKKIMAFMKKRGASFMTLIHNSANISGNAKIGDGCIFVQSTNVNDCAVIGEGVVFNIDATAAHDVTIGNYTCLMGSVLLNGYVQVGDEVYFGAKATVLPHGSIGTGAMVGAGSVVFKCVKPYTSVFGMPARPIYGIGDLENRNHDSC